MINFLIYIPVILTLAGLAFFVYLQNPKVAHNRLFAITVVLILGWSTSLLFADTASNIANSLLAIRVAILFASLIPLFYLYFSLIFPFSSQISKLKYALLAIPAIALSLSSFSPQMIRSVHYEGLGAQIDEFGALYVLLGLYFAIYFISSFIILFRKRKHSLRASAQIKLIIWGSVVTVLLNLFSNFVFVALDMTQYTILFGAPTVILFVATMAYVIVRHRLFDIRLVVARSLAYALVILTLGLVYGYFVFGFVDQFFPDTGTSTLQQAFYTISAVFLVFTFQPLKRFFDKLTNRLFYQDSYDSEDVLNRLGKVFVAKSNSFDLLDDSLDIIVDTLKVEFGRLIVLGNDGIYKATHIGSSEEIKVDITDLEKLEDKITILDEVSGKEVESTLNDMNTYVAVKLATNEGLVGYLLLGTKRSGTIYTKQDINLLEILSQELAVAIEN
ncbi:MAG: histidine kinase N-terminal 7TM domain-containing protein, partial [Candidatus Saccharimonadales bacterium]